jgi:hypothetical protein
MVSAQWRPQNTGKIMGNELVETRKYHGDNGKFGRGNPGKPKGARRKVTVLAERMMEARSEEVVAAVLD